MDNEPQQPHHGTMQGHSKVGTPFPNPPHPDP